MEPVFLFEWPLLINNRISAQRYINISLISKNAEPKKTSAIQTQRSGF
jgi:hypothetical protein